MIAHTLSALWLPYLIRGDASMMTEKDHAECNAWLEKHGLIVSDCRDWAPAKCRGYVTFLFQTANEPCTP